MAKKNMSKIAAIALAGATAFSTLAMTVSADLVTNSDGTSVSGTVYKYVYNQEVSEGLTTPVTVYYTTKEAAEAAKETTKGTYTSVNVTTVGSKVTVNGGIVEAATDETTGTVYKTTNSSASTGTSTGSTTVSNAYRYASDTVYFSTLTNTYYPNLAALKYAEGSHASYTTSKPGIAYSSTNCYFDPVTGVYYSYPLSGSAYMVSSGSNVNYSTPSTSYRYPSAYSYYSYSTGMYYPNLNALKNVEGSNATYKTVTPATSYSSTYCYFNPATGSYSASPATSSSYAVSSYYYDYYDYYYGNYYGNYYDYYYGNYYDYNDPYFYYFLNKNYLSSSSSSSSSKDTSTASLGNRTGWTSIAKYLKNVSSGSTATIDMNNETVVPSSVMSAIQGRNVTVKLVLDNGVTFTVNGKDVTTAKDVDIDTTYNTKSISTKLIKAAYKKNDAVSSAQLSIDAGTLGFNSDLTVKFSAKRSGYKAKLYRYNSAKNSLQLVDTATIGSTGKCNFDNVTKGGEFVVVIYK